jgi:hypothetical protein
MFWIEVIGYDYGGGLIYGRTGGYVYSSLGSGAYTGSIVAQYINTTTNYLEIVVNTNNSGTSNRWGSQVFRGGTDPITASHPLSIVQYSWTSSTAQVY